MVTLENMKSFADVLNKYEVSSPEQLENILVKRIQQLESLKKKYKTNEEYRQIQIEKAKLRLAKNYESEEFREKHRERMRKRYYEKKAQE